MYGKAAYSSTTAFITSLISSAKSLSFNKELLNFGVSSKTSPHVVISQ